MNDVQKTVLSTNLNDNEKLLWSGIPKEFKPIDKTHSAGAIFKIILTAVIVACAIVAYYIIANSMDIATQLLIPIVIVIIGLVVLFPTLTTDASITGLIYGITDKRVIVIRNNKEVHSVNFSQIKSVSYSKDADGLDSIRIGKKAQALSDAALRNASDRAPVVDQNTLAVDKFVLYAVPEIEKAKAIITEYAGK